MIITPYSVPGRYKTGSLSPYITPKEIERVLGFPPNIQDDSFKVTHSWGFLLDGQPCGIWDYCGQRWSTFGDVQQLFDLSAPTVCRKKRWIHKDVWICE